MDDDDYDDDDEDDYDSWYQIKLFKSFNSLSILIANYLIKVWTGLLILAFYIFYIYFAIIFYLSCYLHKNNQWWQKL